MSSDATEQKWPYRANPNTLAALLREAGVAPATPDTSGNARRPDNHSDPDT